MKKGLYLALIGLFPLITLEAAMEIRSPAFKQGSTIPQKYTCEGEDISPELDFDKIPERTRSLVLIVEDPDAPRGTFIHWYGWNIPANKRMLGEGEKLPVEGRNGFGDMGYRGPCPPPGKPHRYFFKIFALDKMIDLEEGTSKHQLDEEMKGHIIEQAELMGLYKR